MLKILISEYIDKKRVASFLRFVDELTLHSRNFMPSPGRLHHYQPPMTSDTIRIDTGVGQGK